MTYRFNVCLLSSVFERSYGLTNFSKDYAALLNNFRDLEWSVNNLSYTLHPKTIGEYVDYEEWRKYYRLFCKLSHFFDDFNFFVNESVRTRTEHDSKNFVLRRFTDFVRRVESMSIPEHFKIAICKFLEKYRDKLTSWEVPKLLPQGDLNILYSKPKLYITDTQLIRLGVALNKEAEIGEDGLNRFDRTRAELLRQLATTLQKLPYIRLGQLLSNSLPEGTDIFYVTDAKLIQLLKDFEAHH
jgi:hypothetical protein